MSDEIDELIYELERLLREKHEREKEKSSFDSLDKPLEEILAEVDRDYQRMLNSLKPRSQRRAERFDEVLREWKEKLSKPNSKPH